MNRSPTNCLSLGQHETINKHNLQPSIYLVYDALIKHNRVTLSKLGRQKKAVNTERETGGGGATRQKKIKHYQLFIVCFRPFSFNNIALWIWVQKVQGSKPNKPALI